MENIQIVVSRCKDLIITECKEEAKYEYLESNLSYKAK